MKKLLLFLAMILCSVCAVSCSGGSDKNENGNTNADRPENMGEGGENSVEADSGLYDPMLPENDFGGYDFKILNVDSSAMPWAIVNVDMAEQTGDVVEDAIYLRNRNVEGKYNINIKEIALPLDSVNKAIDKMSKSGSDDYDLFVATAGSMPSHAINGYIEDLHKVEYINLDKPWWNQTAKYYFSIGGKLFFTTSDFILTDNENLATLAYNKKIAEELGLESAEQMYRLVKEGKWTWSKFTQMCRTAYKNVDGSGAINYETDRFGAVSAGWWFGSAILVSFNEPIINKDKDDMPYIACKNSRFADVYAAMMALMDDKRSMARTSVDFDNFLEWVYERDGALFAGTLVCGYRIMKGMKSDSALLPMPKYDDRQDKYYTFAADSTCMAVPSMTAEPGRSGFMLEALSAESAKILTPAYYEKALNMKYLRDEGSVQMLDIILENQVYDICYTIYNWGGFTDTIRSACMKNNADIVSLIEKHEPKIQAAMQKTIDAYNSLD